MRDQSGTAISDQPRTSQWRTSRDLLLHMPVESARETVPDSELRAGRHPHPPLSLLTVVRHGVLVQNILRAMGQDPPLCLIPSDRR